MSTIKEFFCNGGGNQAQLERLLVSDSLDGQDWTRDDLVSLAESFCMAIRGELSVQPMLIVSVFERLANQDNPKLTRRMATIIIATVADYMNSLTGTPLRPRDYNHLMCFLNILAEKDDMKCWSKHQVKVLESLMKRWLPDSKAIAPNGTIVCMTLLNQYDNVVCDNRKLISNETCQILKAAIQKGDHNVQLFSKIILEGQVQSSARHLLVNQVTYESDGPSQYEGIDDAMLGFTENADYMFIFGSFPDLVKVQVLHKSEVINSKANRNNNCISLTLECRSTKHQLSIPVRERDAHFKKRIEELSTFLGTDAIIKAIKSGKQRKTRCARSEVDLHIHFDEEKSQNREPTQEEMFFSPPEEDFAINNNYRKPQNPPQKVAETTPRSATGYNSDYSHIPTVAQPNVYPIASVRAEEQTIKKTAPKRPKSTPRKRRTNYSSDEDYQPGSQKRPTRRAAAVAKSGITTYSKLPALERARNVKKVCDLPETVRQPDRKQRSSSSTKSKGGSVNASQQISQNEPMLTEDELSRQQSSLFDSICLAPPKEKTKQKQVRSKLATLPKPREATLKNAKASKPIETPETVKNPVTTVGQNAPKRPETSKSMIVTGDNSLPKKKPEARVTSDDSGVVVNTDELVDKVMQQIVRQGTQRTINIFKSDRDIDEHLKELEIKTKEFRELENQYSKAVQKYYDLKSKLLEIIKSP